MVDCHSNGPNKWCLPYPGVGIVSSQVDYRVGYMTCFGPWNLSKQDVSRDVKVTCTLELLSLNAAWSQKKPELICWRHMAPTNTQHLLLDMYTRSPATIQPQKSFQRTALTWVIPGENSRRTTQFSAAKVVNALEKQIPVKQSLFVKQGMCFHIWILQHLAL